MQTQAVFGSERKFDLKQVICLYHDAADHSHACAATIHDVKLEKKKPVIQSGVPITYTGVEQLAIALGRRIDASLLPECVLSITMSQIVWWCPSSRRRIWFAPAPNVKEKSADLKKLNGKFVLHPALLFIAGRDLRIYALAEDARPKANTPVHVAPYYNLSANSGSMCNGTVSLPKVIGPDAIPGYEKAFFGSAFSHSNWGHQLTRHPGGHLGYWQEMAALASKAFPSKRSAPWPPMAKYLVKTRQTVGSVIKGRSED